MNPTETVGVDTPLEIAAMSPDEFVSDTQRKWNFAEKLVAVVNDGVTSGELRPLEGAKITSCITAEIFDHAAYHSQGILGVSPTELLTYAHRLFGGEVPKR